jgi:tetratricopeptide (TPR) repeat protein
MEWLWDERGGAMKKTIVVLVMLLWGICSAPAQEYDWDEFGYDDLGYDWGAEIEEPPDFVDPYAPVPAPAPAAPAEAPPPVPSAAAPQAAEAPLPETPLPEAPFAEAQAGAEPDIVEGSYHRIVSDTGAADAALLLKELELRMDYYNRLFHFDKERIAGPLQVRSIADAEAYEAYTLQRLGQAPPGAVYIHYSRPERRELVINRGSSDEAAMVAHQAFIQCLLAFIPNPPSWMRDGFAVIFSSLRFDPPSEELVYEEDLAWLDRVKQLGAAAAPPRLILLADTEEYARGSIDNFKILSWALASFFLHYDTENYFRSLTEMFMVLSPEADAAENSLAAAKRLTLWTDFDSLAGDYQAYLDAKNSFAALIEAGQKAYGQGDWEAAERRFAQARSMRPDHAVPYYYQGLLSYNARDFAKAEELYNAALYNGADPALVRYALGLNAVSAGRSPEGIRWLEQAAAAEPERFGEKAAAIIKRLR